MGKNNVKQKSNFKKFLKRYIFVLCIVSIIFLIYVMNTLYQYEDSYTDNYMSSFVKDLAQSAKKGKINKYCSLDNIKVNELESNKNDCQKSLEEIVKTSDLGYKLEKNNKSAQEAIYGVYANNNKIMDVTLSVKKQNKRLSLFSYPTWQVKECKINEERGLFYYDILVPSNYTVKVNQATLSESYISNSETDTNYEIFAKYTKLAKMVNYKLDNFVTEPNIVILDDKGNQMSYEIKNHKVELSSLYKAVDNYEDAKQYLAKEIDVMDIAKKWSLFLTDDLSGDRHGFTGLSKYLIKGTSLYQMAYSWATSVDITFTSKHTLKNPAFTNTKVSDFEIYGKDAFACTVYLEKNMTIANNNEKVDVMHDKLYFVYYDDTNDGVDNPQWKMVDMKAVTEK